MTEVLDNPAARLYTALRTLKSCASNMPTPHAVAKAVSSNPDDHIETASRLSLLLSLPNQIVSEIEETEEIVSRELLLRWCDPVSHALNELLFFNGPINQITAHYGNEDLFALQMCSDVLHRHRREVIISDAELERITELINDLRTTLLQAEHIDSELRNMLLSHIRTMEQAIYEIPLRGTTGLRQALAETVGTLSLRPDLVTKQEKNKDVWQKLTAILGVLAAALSFGTATLQALEAPPASPPANITIVENQPSTLPAITAPNSQVSTGAAEGH